MAQFRVPTPRLLAQLAVEGGLIFGVLSLLAALTSVSLDGFVEPASAAHILAGSMLFLGCIQLLRQAPLPRQINIRQETLLLWLVCLAIGGSSFLVYWAVFGSPNRLLSVLMLESAVAVPATLLVWRWVAQRLHLQASFRERILIVGTGEMAREVCRWIAEHRPHKYSIVGFAAEDDSRMCEVLAMGRRVLTDYASLPEFCPQRVDRLIVALDEKRGKLPVRELVAVRLKGFRIEESTSFFERNSGRISVEMLLPSWLIYSEGFKASRLRTMLKRCGDLGLSAVLLVLTLPLMLLTAIAVRLDSPGPALYRQRRMGLDGHEFDVLKFRSMYQDAEKSGPTWARRQDPRITRVGALIRKIRVDELPQLINVLRGEMSFVGPRPERRHFVHQLEEKIPFYSLRLTVRPGITGWAQVEYHYGDSVEDAMEKLKYDLYYIKNCNLFLDMWIVLKTVKVVLAGTGAR